LDISKRVYKRHYKGEQIGDLTLIERMPGGQKWKCVCTCGEIVITQISQGSRACKKCAYLKNAKERTLHGESPSHGKNADRLYRIWTGMRNRCNNPRNKSYKDYGGRGISVCNEWSDYLVFKDWAIKNGYTDKFSIDRIDNDGNYEPSNCRWVNQREQMKNTRNNTYITINGITKIVADWCRELGITKGNMYVKCKKLNMPIEVVINYCYENKPDLIPYTELSKKYAEDKEAAHSQYKNTPI